MWKFESSLMMMTNQSRKCTKPPCLASQMWEWEPANVVTSDPLNYIYGIKQRSWFECGCFCILWLSLSWLEGFPYEAIKNMMGKKRTESLKGAIKDINKIFSLISLQRLLLCHLSYSLLTSLLLSSIDETSPSLLLHLQEFTLSQGKNKPTAAKSEWCSDASGAVSSSRWWWEH